MPNNHRYEDMLHLPRPVSRRAPMSMIDRAAQFSPFAALTGYDASIRETARLTEDQRELDESGKAILNGKLQILSQVLDTQPEVTIIHFQPDERKNGGAYLRTTGRVRKVDPDDQVVILTDRTTIPISRIREIQGEIFLAHE